jgi:hypothetical protein
MKKKHDEERMYMWLTPTAYSPYKLPCCVVQQKELESKIL